MAVHSQYLAKLSKDQTENLINKLLEIQNNQCFICGEEINKSLHTIHIDHIKPLANKGKDDETNFAITHANCNQKKNDADLQVARILFKLQTIRDNAAKNRKIATLQDVLDFVSGSKFAFRYEQNGDSLTYSFPELGDNTIYKTRIFTDNLSNEQFCFIEVPLEYIYHDEKINPRGLNNGIDKLIKEFYKTNPQLHLSLARLEDNYIKIFDGQHKAVAQIMLGTKKLVLRLFLNPDVRRLTETNKNAGSSLKQVAFDKSIIRQLNDTLFKEKIEQYRKQKGLADDDLSFSEQNLVDFFKGESSNIRKYIIANLKQSIIEDPDNLLRNYIDKGGRDKELPISASAFEKTFLTLFINSKNILSTPMDFQEDEGTNPRFLEKTQIVKLLNIIAEEIFINKFNMTTGVNQIEDKIITGRDENITAEHLTAYRMSKEEILYAWLNYISLIIKTYFLTTGKTIEDNYFEYKFDEQLWVNIRNFIKNLKELPLWVDRSMASSVFSGKKTYRYWQTIFETGNAPDGAKILVQPIKHLDMQKYTA